MVRIIGKEIKHYPEVTSTNDIALKLAAEGAREGTVVTADFQTKGRGRQGRDWVSPKGRGLLLSVILKPNITLEQSLLIILWSSLAVVKAIEKTVSVKTQIKWPNDIFFKGKKMGGILTESNSEDGCVKSAVVGIGLNVNSDINDLPEGATSIKEAIGRQLPIKNIQDGIFKQLDCYYRLFKKGHLEQIIGEYRQNSLLLGRRIKAVISDRTIEGQAVDISAKGALVVRLDTGVMADLRWLDVQIIR